MTGADESTEELTAPTRIHPTAIIDEGAEIGEGVSVGPYSIIGPRVAIGPGTTIGSGVLIERDTTVGKDCRIHHGAAIGTDPQDLKYKDEASTLRIGDRTTIREFATLNRGTAATGTTIVGSDCLLMAYSHVAHDCVLGEHVILSNAVNMGGHVEIGAWATLGGVSAVHQFMRIGTYAFVGGASKVTRDVVPYTLVSGNPAQLVGLNAVGLERHGFDEGVRRALKRTVRELARSSGTVVEAIELIRSGSLADVPEVHEMIEFIESASRGIVLR